MGITIDKAIDIMEHYKEYGVISQRNGRNKAIDTMRKYKKIEQIIEVWHQDIFAKDFECIAEVAEVVEDGNDKV